MKKVRPFFFLIAAIVLSAPLCARAEELTLKFREHDVLPQEIRTFLSVSGDISYDTVDAIRNGITAKIFITFEISSSARFIGKSGTNYHEKTETFNISYDVWENKFVILDNKRRDSYLVPSPWGIVETINTVINPLSMDISRIEPADHLYMRAKIRIQTIRLFPPFGIFLLFFDPWNFDSGWVFTEVAVRDTR
jgi:hypothetical protein